MAGVFDKTSNGGERLLVHLNRNSNECDESLYFAFPQFVYIRCALGRHSYCLLIFLAILELDDNGQKLRNEVSSHRKRIISPEFLAF